MPPATLQEVVSRLTAFWTGQGTLQLPSVDLPIASATLAPQTYLRLLGPEPWKVARQQVVRRPGHGRYGKNALRSIRQLEYQLLLKPAVGGIDDLLIKSLKSAGFELELRDLKLREDQWQVPSLGVRGSGWRVSLDGIPVVRVSFLDRLGAHVLEPSCVELAFALERLAMLQQRSSSAAGVEWSEVHLRVEEVDWHSEEDLSTYSFEMVDVDLLRDRIDSALGEASRCLKGGLIFPAYERVLDAIHCVELLKARQGLLTSNWEQLVARCRGLAIECAEAFLAHRERLGFPGVAQEG